MKHNRLVWPGVGLVVCTMVATGFLLGCGPNQVKTTAAAACSQAAIVAAERGTPFLNPDAASIAVPQGEPPIVATVNGQPITAARLEMMVQDALYTEQTTLASLGAGVPPTVQAQLTRSPATLRRLLLTQLIDNALWVSQGQHAGQYASVATAQKQLKQSVALSHSTPVTSPAHVQFVAFLCVNHLTEASYQTDPRVVQTMRNALTIAAVKAHVRSMLPLAQQNDPASVKIAENSYVQSLWSKNRVKIFLPGFIALRM